MTNDNPNYTVIFIATQDVCTVFVVLLFRVGTVFELNSDLISTHLPC